MARHVHACADLITPTTASSLSYSCALCHPFPPFFPLSLSLSLSLITLFLRDLIRSNLLYVDVSCSFITVCWCIRYARVLSLSIHSLSQRTAHHLLMNRFLFVSFLFILYYQSIYSSLFFLPICFLAHSFMLFWLCFHVVYANPYLHRRQTRGQL